MSLPTIDPRISVALRPILAMLCVACGDVSESTCSARWTDEDVRRKTLCGADLTDQDLSQWDLSAADLSETELTAVVLRQDLRDTNFSDANLSDSDLTGADLRNAIFTNARLSGAILDGAKLEGAVFGGANLEGLSAKALPSCPRALPSPWKCRGKRSNYALVGPTANRAPHGKAHRLRGSTGPAGALAAKPPREPRLL